jgi:hypothetical protein
MSGYLAALTNVQLAISLIAIVSGFAVAYGLLANRRLEMWTAVFLATTSATSLSGFLFPITRFTPGLAVGILSTILLGVALVAKYGYDFAGWWRVSYVATAVAAFYLNFFVLIVQSFQKVPALKALAPTQTEPPFAVAQLAALAAFVVLGIGAARNFHPASLVVLRKVVERDTDESLRPVTLSGMFPFSR